MASRPVGAPSKENFKYTQTAVPEPKDGEVLVRALYLSVDPYIRARMRNVKSYIEPMEVGDVIEGGIVGRVEKSRSASFKEGDMVNGRLGWQDYAIAKPEDLTKVPSDPKKLSARLGVLGMPGLTAYFALTEIGKPKAGETVLVSAAAGAVGSAVGQIAKIKGCRTVGIAGGADKIKVCMEDFGYDEMVDYKTKGKIRKLIQDACPKGVDIYFDNVGGEISDGAITQINMKARIIICGQISTINRDRPEMGPRSAPLYLLTYRAKMEGFLVHDYLDRYPEGLRQLEEWFDQGKLKHRETIVDGLGHAHDAFMGLFTGANVGKMIVKVAD